MASTYSNLKVQLMTTGENTGSWGTVTNTNLGTALEEAITGSANVTFASGDVTLTLTNTNSTQSARNLRLNCTGTTGGSPRNLILGSGCQIEKVYIVNNECGDAITIKNTTGTGISVPAGKTMYVFNNGTNVVDAITHLSSLTLTSPLSIASGGTGSSTGDGSALTNLNASNISTGTLANARTTAASANGASTIVARDASGNFSANTVTANLIGTAANAAVLQTARTIAIQDGVTGTATSFDGSNNISIPVTAINASVINTGTIANARTTASDANGVSTIVARDASGNFSANVITASLNGNASTATTATTATTANKVANSLALATSGTGLSGSASFDGSSTQTFTVTSNANSANGASTIVARDASGNFSANTVTANLTGTASNATVLQTARTIAIQDGVTGTATSFNGSANISIPVTGINVSVANAGTLAVARGGTGITSPGTAGNVLTSNGSAWVSTTTHSFVAGMILMWSGTIAGIPSGWALCNGLNGTPDLRDRFVVGAGSSYVPGVTGGSSSTTLSEANLPSHTHSFSATTSTAGSHSHSLSIPNVGYDLGIASVVRSATGSPVLSSNQNVSGLVSTEGSHTHTVSGTTGSTGSGTSFTNLPPYYALAFIMKL